MDQVVAPDEAKYLALLSKWVEEYVDNKTKLQEHYRHLQEVQFKIRSLEKPYLSPLQRHELLTLSRDTDHILAAIDYCSLKARDLRTVILEFISFLNKDYLLTLKNQNALIRKTKQPGSKEETLIFTNENGTRSNLFI